MSVTTTDIDQAGVVPDREDVADANEALSSDGEFVFEELPDAPPRQGFRMSAVGWVCTAIVMFWIAIVFVGPFIAPFDEAEYIEDVIEKYEEVDTIFMDPDANAWLGTDSSGRDVFSRVLWGARTTIGISFTATILAYVIGITLGIAAAVAGGWTDTVFSRLVDAILTFPNIMLGLVVIAGFSPFIGRITGSQFWDAIIILIALAGVVYAASVYRIARALGQDIMVQDFVEAARARGEGTWYIIRKEVLPNAAMPLATDFGLRLVFVILFVTSLSFLGLGVQPPASEWGSMVRESLSGMRFGEGGNIWATIAPAIAIASVTISINLIVDDISAQAGGSLAKKMV
ncbi:MAG: ABC transporter permease [Pseudomonadota bacterium]